MTGVVARQVWRTVALVTIIRGLVHCSPAECTSLHCIGEAAAGGGGNQWTCYCQPTSVILSQIAMPGERVEYWNSMTCTTLDNAFTFIIFLSLHPQRGGLYQGFIKGPGSSRRDVFPEKSEVSGEGGKGEARLDDWNSFHLSGLDLVWGRNFAVELVRKWQDWVMSSHIKETFSFHLSG